MRAPVSHDLPEEKIMSTAHHPSVSFTPEALVIRIPWDAMKTNPLNPKARKLTARDVLEIVEAGRLAHALGRTRSVRSLKALLD